MILLRKISRTIFRTSGTFVLSFSAALIFCQSLSAKEESFCDRALRASDVYWHSVYPQAQVRISKNAFLEMREANLSPEELEILIGESKINSYQRGDEILLPIFRTVRTDRVYRDYVFLLTLRKPFFAGKRSEVYVDGVQKVTEKFQRYILSDLANELRARGYRFKTRLRGLNHHGFPRGVLNIEVSPTVSVKLQFKHKIEMSLLKSALEQNPDRIIPSERFHDRVELLYFGDKIMLTVVLARPENDNTTPLVTSYFTQRVD